jgi:hypothetical protein
MPTSAGHAYLPARSSLPPLLADYFDLVLSRRVHPDLTPKRIRVGSSVEAKDMP